MKAKKFAQKLADITLRRNTGVVESVEQTGYSSATITFFNRPPITIRGPWVHKLQEKIDCDREIEVKEILRAQ